MESCNVQWSMSSDGLFSSQLTKPCTAVSLPEQRCQNNLVPHFGAVCSLITFGLFKTLFFPPLLLRSLVSILTYSLQLLLQISCCCLMRKICNNNEIISLHFASGYTGLDFFFLPLLSHLVYQIFSLKLRATHPQCNAVSLL